MSVPDRGIPLSFCRFTVTLHVDSTLRGEVTQVTPYTGGQIARRVRETLTASYFAMNAALYGVAVHLPFALYVAGSAYNRKLGWWSAAWAVPALFFGVLVIPFFRAFRPLKQNEVRRGGKVYVVLRDYARIIILLMIGVVLAVCTITQNPSLITQNPTSLTEAEQTGAILGSWLGMICYIPIGFVVWVIPRMFRSDAVIEGPTGPLADGEE